MTQPGAGPGTIPGTGIDPAITGEPPEERTDDCSRAAASVEPDGTGPSQPNERSCTATGRTGHARWYRGADRFVAGVVLAPGNDVQGVPCPIP
jgi:hypothetical protein